MTASIFVHSSFPPRHSSVNLSLWPTERRLAGIRTELTSAEAEAGGWSILRVARTVVFMAAILLALAAPVHAADNEIKKDWAHWQQTEFCASVKRPPQKLIESINIAAAQDPKGMAGIVAWMQHIVDRWEKNGCGDT